MANEGRSANCPGVRKGGIRQSWQPSKSANTAESTQSAQDNRPDLAAEPQVVRLGLAAAARVAAALGAAEAERQGVAERRLGQILLVAVVEDTLFGPNLLEQIPKLL